jgi:hypothetical protein
MLVFELTSEGDQLEIHLDRAGLSLLQGELRLLQEGETHVHLKTKAWAGAELSDEPQAPDHKVLNHVKIMRWDS